MKRIFFLFPILTTSFAFADPWPGFPPCDQTTLGSSHYSTGSTPPTYRCDGVDCMGNTYTAGRYGSSSVWTTEWKCIQQNGGYTWTIECMWGIRSVTTCNVSTYNCENCNPPQSKLAILAAVSPPTTSRYTIGQGCKDVDDSSHFTELETRMGMPFIDRLISEESGSGHNDQLCGPVVPGLNH